MDRIRLLTAVLFLASAATGATAPMLSIYLQSLDASYTLISFILTSYALTLILGNFWWGRISDRLRQRKPLVVGGLLGMSAAFWLLSSVPDYRMAWLVRIGEGVAMSAYMTTSLAFVGDLLEQDQNRGRRIGSYRGFGSLSFALGALGAGPVIDHFGMRQVYMLGAICYLAAGLMALAIREVPATPSGAEADRTSAVGMAKRVPIPGLFLAAVAFWSAAHSAQASMWPNYLVSLGYRQSTANWLWGIAALSELPLMSFAGYLSDAVGRMPVLIVGGAAMAVVMGGYILVGRWIGALVGLQFVRGFGYSAFTATSMIFAAEIGTARTRAGSVGAYNMAMGMGQLAGLAAAGQIVDRFSFPALFGTCLLAYLGSAGLFWVMAQRPEQGNQPTA